jgi:hypothetical protein
MPNDSDGAKKSITASLENFASLLEEYNSIQAGLIFGYDEGSPSEKCVVILPLALSHLFYLLV